MSAIFIFNNTLRVSNHHLKELKELNVYGLYIGEPNDFVSSALFHLKEKLKPYGIPLFLFDDFPETKIKNVYVNQISKVSIPKKHNVVKFDDLLFDIKTRVYKDKEPKRYIQFKGYFERTTELEFNYEKPVLIKKDMIESTEFKGETIISAKKDPYNVLGKLLILITKRINAGDSFEYNNTRLSEYLLHGLLDIRGFYSILLKHIPRDHYLFKKIMTREFYYRIYEEIEKDWKKILPNNVHKLYDYGGMDLIKEWKEGNTGFPIIDACMRCAAQTNYLSYRKRLLVANFWVKLCNGFWKVGEKHFKSFIDYDPALSTCNWLYAAGVLDTVKDRILNPWNSIKYDVNAKFIKKWVPELKEKSVNDIHNMENGEKYIEPIIDYKNARQEYLDFLKIE